MSERLRVELQFKNAALYNALREKRPPTNPRQRCADIKAVAREIGISYGMVLSYLKLTASPWGANGDPRRTAEKLSLFLEIDCEQLFPRRLYSGVFPQRLVKEIDAGKYLTYAEAVSAKLLPASTADQDFRDQIWLAEARNALETALQTLTPREQLVLERRFGLNSNPQTVREIGQVLVVTGKRICQIEAKALRKLRHPFRAKWLLPLLEERH